jgi:hypothetical protein
MVYEGCELLINIFKVKVLPLKNICYWFRAKLAFKHKAAVALQEYAVTINKFFIIVAVNNH